MLGMMGMPAMGGQPYGPQPGLLGIGGGGKKKRKKTRRAGKRRKGGKRKRKTKYSRK